MSAASRALAPAELKQAVELSRGHSAFLVWRTSGSLEVLGLDDRGEVSLGRRSANDVAVPDDLRASRAHARLERLGDEWVILDDGISRNGTFVNGVRITGRRRLDAGDVIRIGTTEIDFHRERREGISLSTAASLAHPDQKLTPTQQRVLVALCRPYREGKPFPTPASNIDIAREVFLGVDAVKSHLRELYRRFDIADLPQNTKRGYLAQQALQLGLAGE